MSTSADKLELAALADQPLGVRVGEAQQPVVACNAPSILEETQCFGRGKNWV